MRLAAILACVLGAAPPAPKIVDKPIHFDAERRRLTIEYRRAHQDPAADGVEIAPRVIVLHFTGSGSAKGTWEYFDRTTVEAARKTLARAGAVNVSAHFLVDRDGTIWRLLPETTMARHCIGLNHIAIGIENVGDGDKLPLTDAQVEADAALVRLLAGRFPITHVIGHSEADRMEPTPYWKELDPKYRNGSDDPGREFLRKVRAKIADLKLEGPP